MINIKISELQALDSLKSRDDRLLEAALIYVASGSKVVPLAPNSKEPVYENWREMASADPGQIRRWFGPNGPHRGGNIALLIEKYYVVDVDQHPGKPDGFKTLGKKLDGAACPISRTPTGNGKHFLVANTKLTSGNGVDVLGSGKLHTVYPSEIDGKQYQWEMGGLPGQLRELALVKTDENIPEAAEALAPGPYCRELLEYIDPDCDYDVWLRVGMALHHNDAGHVGFMAWDDWSKKGTKYKDGETESKWRGFDANRGKPTTIKWLIGEAIKCGKPLTNEDRVYWSGIDVDIHIDRLNQKYAVYDNKGDITIVYIENGDLHTAKPKSWGTKMLNDMILIDGKPKPMADIWLRSPNRREIKKIGMWMPGTEPPDTLNIWTGFDTKPIESTEEDISEFLEFMLNVLCRGNKKYFSFLCDMLTLKFTKPLVPHRLCLVLRGGEGVGKGLFTSCIEQIIGRRHAINVSSGKWLGQFGGALISGKVWISANETHWAGNHSEGERLKGLVTEYEIDLEVKNVNAWRADNYLMVAITTNNEWAVPASADSRRFFVLDVDGSRAHDVHYWRRLVSLVGMNDLTRQSNNPEYLGKILYYFQNRKIENPTHRAMDTTWLSDQRKASSMGSIDDMFISWVREVVTKDRSNDVLTGTSGKYFPIMERKDGGTVVKTEGMYLDFREYANKKSGRHTVRCSQAMFNDKMNLLGLAQTRVRKAMLQAGGRPLDSGNEDSKIVVAALPSIDDIEAKIREHFSLFAEDIPDESDSGS